MKQILRLKIVPLFFLIQLFSCAQTTNQSNQPKQATPPDGKTTSKNKTMTTDTAVFGAGCFWCVEAIYQQVNGVLKVESGYAGGTVVNPTYKQVCTGTTGHAEVTRILFDPQKVSFEQLLEVFFKVHDPTTLNRQGEDVGTQYRSAIFYTSPQQKEIAEKVKKALNEGGAFEKPIVTEITAFTNFFKAEDYHQDYYNLHGEQPYCKFVIQPKVEKFEKVFKKLLAK